MSPLRRKYINFDPQWKEYKGFVRNGYHLTVFSGCSCGVALYDVKNRTRHRLSLERHDGQMSDMIFEGIIRSNRVIARLKDRRPKRTTW